MELKKKKKTEIADGGLSKTVMKSIRQALLKSVCVVLCDEVRVVNRVQGREGLIVCNATHAG